MLCVHADMHAIGVASGIFSVSGGYVNLRSSQDVRDSHNLFLLLQFSLRCIHCLLRKDTQGKKGWPVNS